MGPSGGALEGQGGSQSALRTPRNHFDSSCSLRPGNRGVSNFEIQGLCRSVRAAFDVIGAVSAARDIAK
eukprot:9491060-Pyramimonas_sp.AAC.1